MNHLTRRFRRRPFSITGVMFFAAFVVAALSISVTQKDDRATWKISTNNAINASF